MGEKRCYYDVLGVARDASCDDIRRAYKREALKHHPDRNPGNADAECQFKVVNEAYQVLSDENKRGVYDQFGHAGLEGGGGVPGGAGFGDVFTHMQDLFSEMFSGAGFPFGGGRQQRGQDLRVQQRITLAEAAFGCKKELTVEAPARCGTCQGVGAAPGTKPEACGTCRGTGQVSTSRGFVMFSSPCGRCGGRGQVIKQACKDCRGEGVVVKPKTVTVTFPAGVDGGQRLRVPGHGVPSPHGAGDLYVEIEVEEDPRFERDGIDLVTRVNVSFTDAALGAEVDVATLEPNPGGDSTSPSPSAITTTKLTIPSGTQPGAIFTMKGRGIPRLDGRGRGSLVVQVQVDVPRSLSPRAKQLLLDLDSELRGEEPRTHKRARS